MDLTSIKCPNRATSKRAYRGCQITDCVCNLFRRTKAAKGDGSGSEEEDEDEDDEDEDDMTIVEMRQGENDRKLKFNWADQCDSDVDDDEF